MTRTIIRERIPSTDPRLRRHVHHDSESRRYAFDTAGLTLVSTKHQRRIPVLDQGQLGSCTGNAGVGCLGTDPYYGTAVPLLSLPEFDDPEALQARYEKAARAGKVIVLAVETEFDANR